MSLFGSDSDSTESEITVPHPEQATRVAFSSPDRSNGELIRMAVLSTALSAHGDVVPDCYTNRQLRTGIEYVCDLDSDAVSQFDAATIRELAKWFGIGPTRTRPATELRFEILSDVDYEGEV
jgi:hypothetical protein